MLLPKLPTVSWISFAVPRASLQDFFRLQGRRSTLLPPPLHSPSTSLAFCFKQNWIFTTIPIVCQCDCMIKICRPVKAATIWKGGQLLAQCQMHEHHWRHAQFTLTMLLSMVQQTQDNCHVCRRVYGRVHEHGRLLWVFRRRRWRAPLHLCYR